MRVSEIYSQVAWGEREAIFRSAKWSAAMVVATFSALLIFCGSGSVSYAGQSRSKLPVTTDWSRWTEQECDAVLHNSPWANGLFPLSSENAEAQEKLKLLPQTDMVGIVQLRSALPVRQALFRELQFQKHYDTMSPQQKQTFDKNHPPGMTENESDPIVLYVEHYGRSLGFGQHNPIARENENPAREAALRLSDGTLVMPIKTEALQDDSDANRFEYSFPRLINGTPSVTLSGETLTFVFGRALAGGGRLRPLQNAKKFHVATRVNAFAFFRVADLAYNGRLEY